MRDPPRVNTRCTHAARELINDYCARVMSHFLMADKRAARSIAGRRDSVAPILQKNTKNTAIAVNLKQLSTKKNVNTDDEQLHRARARRDEGIAPFGNLAAGHFIFFFFCVCCTHIMLRSSSSVLVAFDWEVEVVCAYKLFAKMY